VDTGFPRDKRESVCAEIMLKQKIERDGDSKKSHHALGSRMIEISHVDKWYGPSFQALMDCSTSVAKGEVVVVCGPSGSGKSTLIKCVNALEPFQSGEIIVDGIRVNDPKTDLPKLRARVGMVFQHFELFPHLRIIESAWRSRRCWGGRETKQSRRPRNCCTGSASRNTRANIRLNCPAANNSALLSRGRWRWTRSPSVRRADFGARPRNDQRSA
jgi:ABC-type Fe3+/spermidine/putrescine transport system ATPase subunit